MAHRRQQVDRYQRQSDWVPQRAQIGCRIAVIGLGAIGKPVVESLAHMGFVNLVLFDGDTVDETNICTQGYSPKDLGKTKAVAMNNYVQAINTAARVSVYHRNWTTEDAVDIAEHALFVCVDSIATRRQIWEAADGLHPFWCDARMLGMTIRVLSAWDNASREHYSTTLFDESEAQTGSCTSRSAIWPARMASSLMINQLVKYINDASPSNIDTLFSLQTYEVADLSVAEV